MSTYCKRCGAMVEADLTIDGYGVRCWCAGDAYRILLQINKRLVEDGERLARLLESHTPYDEMPFEDEYEALDQHDSLMKEMEGRDG